jgi:hypothetical protein
VSAKRHKFSLPLFEHFLLAWYHEQSPGREMSRSSVSLLVIIFIMGCHTLESWTEEKGYTYAPNFSRFNPIGTVPGQRGTYLENPWFATLPAKYALPNETSDTSSASSIGAAAATNGYLKEVADAAFGAQGALTKDTRFRFTEPQVYRLGQTVPIDNCSSGESRQIIVETLNTGDMCTSELSNDSGGVTVRANFARAAGKLGSPPSGVVTAASPTAGAIDTPSNQTFQCGDTPAISAVEVPNAAASVDAQPGFLAAELQGAGKSKERTVKSGSDFTIGYKAISMRCEVQGDTELDVADGESMYFDGVATLMTILASNAQLPHQYLAQLSIQPLLSPAVHPVPPQVARELPDWSVHLCTKWPRTAGSCKFTLGDVFGIPFNASQGVLVITSPSKDSSKVHVRIRRFNYQLSNDRAWYEFGLAH